MTLRVFSIVVRLLILRHGQSDTGVRYKEFVFIHFAMEQDKDERDSEKDGEEDADDDDDDNEEEFLPGFASFQDYSKV